MLAFFLSLPNRLPYLSIHSHPCPSPLSPQNLLAQTLPAAILALLTQQSRKLRHSLRNECRR